MSRHTIVGWGLLEKLAQAGIIPDDRVRRVIIDIPFDDVATLYIERLGDERLYDVFVPSSDMKIQAIEGTDGGHDPA